jgi:nucleotide-binding universal stress UspA family protein
MLGSVTDKVLRRAACPVLSVPPAPDVVPAPPVLFKRILCATDFSESAARALRFALTLAEETDAHLTVLNVAEVPPDLATGGAHSGESALGGYVDELFKERQGLLRAAVPDEARTYCTVETLLTAGKPYRETLRVAAERQIELIVMGVHGRSASDLLFFGSTASHVVREATCPVLTLRGAA